MVEVAHSHSGVNLAAAFAKILEDFAISNKVSKHLSLTGMDMEILSITCDNASNNNMMIE